MKRILMLWVVVLLALGSIDTASAAIREFGPVFNPQTGHWYSIYKTDDGTDISWTAARALAEGEGGYLATLLTEQEDRFVLDAFAGSVISIGVRAWIGLTDSNQEGIFEWVTGPEGVQLLTYNHWLPGEPSDSGNEDFVEWRNEPDGFGTNQAWNDVPNDAAGMFRFMVEFDSIPPVVREFGPVFNPQTGHWYSIYKTADETDITWTAARALAEGKGGYLATLLTEQEDRFVLDGFAGSVISIGVRAWIGLTDSNQEGIFEWVTGPEGIQPLTYNHWLPGEPSNSGDEDFVEWRNEPDGFGTNQAWNDVPNDAAGMFRFMVEFDSIPPGYVTEEFGPVFNSETGHWYSIYKISDETDATWTTARALAEGKGGYLATLLTEQEDRFVLDAFAGSVISIGVRAWIGLTDSNQEGIFEWVTGPEGVQLLTYNHWLPGEPSDSGNEDFVEWRNEPDGFGTNQAWNDVPNDAAGMFRFMVERDSLPPVAICKNVTVEADPGLCSADASVDDGSFDPKGGPVTLSQTPPGPYPVGDTPVVLTVSDSSGLTASCTATVTVVDAQPPVISGVSATPNVLWPPNHKMVPVEVTVAVSDNCTSDPRCTIISVGSNEPVNGLGDGDTAPDWQITGDLTVNLRAERSGKGNGRIYTATLECRDESGNFATGTTTVAVPHDQGKNKKVVTPDDQGKNKKAVVANDQGKNKKAEVPDDQGKNKKVVANDQGKNKKK